MKTFIRTCAFVVSLTFPVTSVDAANGKGREPHARAFELPGHEPIGKPSDGSLFDRTVEITIKETTSGYMLFEPDAIHIESGSIVRFVISNLGALDHEFFLGSFSEVAEHKQWMRDHPDMRHDDPNAVTVQSGQSAELIWEFTDILNLEFVCLLPGHREAGMWGVIMVHDHLAPKSEG
ncbi:cupredoxin domain-containing protein [Sulfitobacter geojensis]|uniref:cupredoxin domain-containing protein n=1 Tax=Sulfitobacter geojensis TaxID=1342299 RepID=UPI000562113E|nr:cupredoxin family protein [Sulfitobacter geojensis]NYI30016.1 putative cupredoxin-like copper-binding protein [Sulfitobacter geojensis]|tara:strand:+ start:12388 stop:12921 length:534 start_codon:yes stop_codon:yes gene_type:complete